MKVIQVVGYKKSGKTTVIEKLVDALYKKGKHVAVFKHCGDDFFGKENDSEIFFHAGASEIFLSSPNLFYERKSAKSIDELLRDARQKYDYFFIEGFKELLYPRIVCFKEDVDNVLLKNVIAISGVIATKDVNSEYEVFDINSKEDLDKLLDKIEKLPNYPVGLNCGKCNMNCRALYTANFRGKDLKCVIDEKRDIEIVVNGKKLELMQFIEKIAINTFSGFLSTLKGYEDGEVEIKFTTKKRSDRK